MRCRICGAKLRKEGDICKDCYKEYMKEVELDKDNTEIYKINRKYLPSFQLTQYIDWYIITFCIIVATMAQNQFLIAIAIGIIALIILGVVMFLQKRRAQNTSCTFYETKVVWKYKDKTKTLAYDDLRDVTFYQSFFQKLFKLADFQFHPAKGTYLIEGFEVRNVPNVESTISEVSEILKTKKGK